MAKKSNTLAIDPGPVESAYVIWDGQQIINMDILDNHHLIGALRGDFCGDPEVCIIEQIKSYGMAVSDSVFDTVYWSGRFCEAWGQRGFFDRIPRMAVKMHICHDSRAGDPNIRRALIDRFEPGLKPRQRPKSTLKGLKDDLWAAFALAVYWHDTGDFK